MTTFVCISTAQNYIDYWSYRSDWNLTLVEYLGDTTCQHSWVEENIRNNSMTSYCVLHDARGCPDGRGRKQKICRKCLRKEIWAESRIIIPTEKQETEIEILNKRLKEKISKTKIY